MGISRLRPKARKWWLLAHVTSSVAWIGVNLASIALVVTALTTDLPGTQHVAVLALDLVGGAVLVPVSLVSLITGVVLSVRTHWGLFRHGWVVAKLAMTAFAVVMIPFSLLPGLSAQATVAAAAPDGVFAAIEPSGLIGAMTVSTTLYLVSTGLSIFKPGGRKKAEGASLGKRPPVERLVTKP